MPFKTIQIKPGFNTQLSPTANESGWSAGNLVRWKNGLLEKVGGWEHLFSGACGGTVRAMHGWTDLNNTNDLLLGTDAGPQLYSNDTLTIVNLTASVAGIFTPSYTSTSGATTVTVEIPSGSLATTGDRILLNMHQSIGGRIVPPGTSFTIKGIQTSTPAPGLDTLTFQMVTAAALSTTALGSPQIILNGDVKTTSLALTNHGVATGGKFTIDAETNYPIVFSFANLEYVPIDFPAGATVTALSITDANTFTFDGRPFLPSGILGSTTSGATLDEGQLYAADGTQVSAAAVSFTVTTQLANPLPNWFADNLGNNGLISYEGGPIFVFMPPATNNPFAVQAGSTVPSQNAGMFVAMPQAQVIVYGTQPVIGTTGVDPLLVRFSDAGSYTVWQATVSNQAGSYRLARGSKIIGGLQAPQTTLLWTDVDVWSMSYIGPPLVYGFTVMGTGCGLVAPHAACTLGRTTYWQSQNSFWTFGDSGVQPLPCPVWDIIFANLNTDSIGRCFSGANSSFHEVWFFFPSATGLFNWGFDKGSGVTLSGDSLVATAATTSMSDQCVLSSGGHSTGKWYAEAKFTATLTTDNAAIGIANSDIKLTNDLGSDSNSWSYPQDFGFLRHGGTNGAAVTTAGNGDIVQIAWDADAGKLWFGLNNAWVGGGNPALGTGANYTGVTGELFIAAAVGADTTHKGQVTISDFSYSPPDGFSVWGAGECDSYVKFNAAENLWDYGNMDRSSWLDNSVFGPPLGSDLNFIVQQHEMGYDADGAVMTGVYAQTGYGQISDGDEIMFIDQIIPDMKWFGSATTASVDLTLSGTNYPGDSPLSSTPVTMTPTTRWLPARMRKRQIQMRLDWAASLGFSARVEAIRFRVAQSGRGPS